jgi:fructan beta-fructosidase
MRRRDFLRTGLTTTGGVVLLGATGPGEAAATPPTTPPAAPPARGDLVLADFEGPDWGGWTAEGTAFGSGPALGAPLLADLQLAGYHGNGVATSKQGGDDPTGTLTSPEFTIQRDYLAFGIGGGDYERVTCLNLVVDGQVVRSATGRSTLGQNSRGNVDLISPASWDVREFAGKRATLRLVDAAGGDWAHVNVDHVVQTDRPERLPVVTQPLYHETYRPRFHFTARLWRWTG